MQETTINHFRANLKAEIDRCIQNSEPLKVTRKRGTDFVVLGAEDWRAIEETIYLNQVPGLVKTVHKAAKEPLPKSTALTFKHSS